MAMNPVTPSSGHTTEALLRASQHWQTQHERGPGDSERPIGFTIALSRATGARATSVARVLGQKLGWHVYDHELLELIAKEMGLRTRLLESVDERRGSWIQDTMAGFALVPLVSETGYVRHLVETLLSLASHGSCILVGRGAAHILPAATTLRVRLVAPLEDRIAVMSRELHVPRDEAARRVKTMDRERTAFIKDHFQRDPENPVNYDLVLNSSRFSVAECADVIVDALRRLQGHSAGSAA
jgi:cytidylate kinase